MQTTHRRQPYPPYRRFLSSNSVQGMGISKEKPCKVSSWTVLSSISVRTEIDSPKGNNHLHETKTGTTNKINTTHSHQQQKATTDKSLWPLISCNITKNQSLSHPLQPSQSAGEQASSVISNSLMQAGQITFVGSISSSRYTTSPQ